MYVYIYVCIYICNVYIYVCIYICMYIYIYETTKYHLMCPLRILSSTSQDVKLLIFQEFTWLDGKELGNQEIHRGNPN